MLKPPKDVSASELFLKLIETPMPSDVIDFPRKDSAGNPVGKIRISTLLHEDHDKARERAFRFFRDRNYSAEDLKQLSMREVLGDRIAKELISMSCLTATEQMTNNETGQPIYGKVFFSADDVGKLRAQEVEVLFNAYMLVQDKYGPREHNTDVDAWVEKLTEGGQAYPLLSMDLPELAIVTSSLAARISTISSVLASLWEELPPTCQSALGRFLSGITSSGEQPSTSDQTTTESFDLELFDALELAKKTRAAETIKEMFSPE